MPSRADAIDLPELSPAHEWRVRYWRWALLLLALLAGIALSQMRRPWERRILERLQESVPSVKESRELVKPLPWLKLDVEHYGALRPKEHGAIGLWYATAASTGLLLLLGISVRRWLPDEGEEIRRDVHVASPTRLVVIHSDWATRLFVVAMVGAVSVAGVLRAPRLSHSFWNDEAYAVRTFVHGQWEEGKDKAWAFTPASWTDTLHEQRNGNNHVLCSLAERGAAVLWRLCTGAPAEQFSETALRMPSIIAALITVVLLGLIGRESGMVWVGIGAAWLLVFHPWHIRYSTEARGYSLMLMGMVLSLWGLIRAVQTHRVSHWAVFALGEAIYLLSFAGSIYVAVAVNALAFIVLALRRQPRRLMALVAMNLLAAVPVMLLFLPSVPQLLGFLAHDTTPRLATGMASLWDIATHLTAGVMPENVQPSVHCGSSWEMMGFSAMHMTSSLGWAVACMGTVGVIMALFENMALRLSVLAMVVAGVLGYVHGTSKGSPNLSWYYLYLLIPLCLALPLLTQRAGRWGIPWLIALVAGFALATGTPRAVMIQRDRQPLRQATEWIHAQDANALTATFGVSDRQALLYDPKVKVLERLEDLQAMEADKPSPLFIYICGDAETKLRHPGLHAAVTRSGRYKLVHQLPGHEAMFSYSVWQAQ
jgi:hypothetical protein